MVSLSPEIGHEAFIEAFLKAFLKSIARVEEHGKKEEVLKAWHSMFAFPLT